MFGTEDLLIPEPPPEPDYFKEFTSKQSSSYPNYDSDKGPKVYELPESPYPPPSSINQNNNPSPQNSANLQASDTLLKIIIPFVVFLILLLFLGVFLFWFLKLRKREPDEKSSSCSPFSSCLFSERLSKCFKSRKTRRSQSKEESPKKSKKLNQPNLANEVCYDDGTHQKLLDPLKPQHQCQVYQPQPQISYVMPKSQYFKRPNPYRNMPPPIDNSCQKNHIIGL